MTVKPLSKMPHTGIVGYLRHVELNSQNHLQGNHKGDLQLHCLHLHLVGHHRGRQGHDLLQAAEQLEHELHHQESTKSGSPAHTHTHTHTHTIKH